MAMWEKQRSEDDVDYGKFLTYRNLGPLRSLKRAYHAYYERFANAADRPRADVQASGAWKELCARHNWKRRALAWDKHNLPRHGTRAAILFIRSLEKVGEKVLKALQKQGTALGGDEWPDIVAGLNLIGKQLSPDALRDSTSEEDDAPDGDREGQDRASVV